MWRPDAECCGHEITRVQELAAASLHGWVLIQTDVGYRAIHNNGLQTQWHDDPDDAVSEAFSMQKSYLVIRRNESRRLMFRLLMNWFRK